MTGRALWVLAASAVQSGSALEISERCPPDLLKAGAAAYQRMAARADDCLETALTERRPAPVTCTYDPDDVAAADKSLACVTTIVAEFEALSGTQQEALGATKQEDGWMSGDRRFFIEAVAGWLWQKSSFDLSEGVLRRTDRGEIAPETHEDQQH